MNVPSIDEVAKLAQYKQHPYGTVWERFDEQTFAKLVGNIKVRGLDKEITLYEGKVLEGWHRYLACLVAEVKPKVKKFEGGHLKAAELVNASGIRRHSTPEQRYASLVMLCKKCPAFAKKYESLKEQGELQKKQGKPLGAGVQSVDVVAAKAKDAGVSKTTAKKIEKVEKENPGAVAEIAAAKTTANKELAKMKRQKAPERKQTKVKDASAKGERPSIREVIQILYRGLTKANEVQTLAPKDKSIEFKVNGYRIKATCKICE